MLAVPCDSGHSEDCTALFPPGWDALMGLQHSVMWWERLERLLAASYPMK